jgi:transcriptional regulator
VTHPAKAFDWDDLPAMRAFARRVAFAHVFTSTADGAIMVGHAPLRVDEDGSIRFHLSRGNRITPHLRGANVLASITDSDFYVSPDWYADTDSVPTWDYIAVEIEGSARALGEAELIALLDDLSAEHEARLTPKKPWARTKMAEGRFAAMLPAICGFAIDAPAWRGTRKLSQNRTAEDRAGVVAALRAAGRLDLATLVETRP